MLASVFCKCGHHAIHSLSRNSQTNVHCPKNLILDKNKPLANVSIGASRDPQDVQGAAGLCDLAREGSSGGLRASPGAPHGGPILTQRLNRAFYWPPRIAASTQVALERPLGTVSPDYVPRHRSPSETFCPTFHDAMAFRGNLRLRNAAARGCSALRLFLATWSWCSFRPCSY